MTVNMARIFRWQRFQSRSPRIIRPAALLHQRCTRVARGPKQNAGPWEPTFYSDGAASALLFKMCTERIDRCELHHALRQLSFDRAVRIERVGHAIDDAGLEDRGPPLGGWPTQNFGHPPFA